VNPEAYLVAEVWHAKPEWLAGRHFDAFMNYPLTQAILGYAPGEHLDLAMALRHDEYRRHLVHRDGPSFAGELQRLLAIDDPDVTAVQLNLLDSHDTARFLTMSHGDVASLRLATLLQMTLPGAPCVYYGDEVGVEGGHDPDNRRAFPWDRSRWDHGLRAYVRALIGLRRRHQALRDGELAVVAAADGAFAMARRAAGERFVVATNVDRVERELLARLPDEWGTASAATLVDLDDPAGATCSTTDGRIDIRLPARSGVVIRIE
jgi:neopullulanase